MEISRNDDFMAFRMVETFTVSACLKKKNRITRAVKSAIKGLGIPRKIQ